MGRSILYKWTEEEKWRKDPPDNQAIAGEIIYAQGDENIEAGTGVNACRLILFYDQKNKKAAILHTNDYLQNEHEKLIDALLEKFSFDFINTQVYLCGDDEGEDEENEKDLKEWNKNIENHLSTLGYKVNIITKGPEKNIKINPGKKRLSIKDKPGNNLLI